MKKGAPYEYTEYCTTTLVHLRQPPGKTAHHGIKCVCIVFVSTKYRVNQTSPHTGGESGSPHRTPPPECHSHDPTISPRPRGGKVAGMLLGHLLQGDILINVWVGYLDLPGLPPDKLLGPLESTPGRLNRKQGSSAPSLAHPCPGLTTAQSGVLLCTASFLAPHVGDPNSLMSAGGTPEAKSTGLTHLTGLLSMLFALLATTWKSPQRNRCVFNPVSSSPCRHSLGSMPYRAD